MIQESSADKRQSLYLYTDEGSYEPLARIDRNGNQEQHIYYFHTDLNGMPEELTDANGKILWECSFQLWGKRIHEIEHEPIEQNLRYQGQYLDRETGLHYNTFRYYDPDIGRFTQPDPIGLLGGFNLYQYAPNGLTWIDPWGWSCGSSAYKGKLNSAASKMKPIQRGTKEWKLAIKNTQAALLAGDKFQVKVKSSTDAKAFLKEAQGNMNRYKAHTQSSRPDGVAKYPKGYEQHMSPESGFGDTPHIKWYNNGTDGHIFYDIPN